MFNGRRPIDLVQFQLTDEELECLGSSEEGSYGNRSALALYQLFLFDVSKKIQNCASVLTIFTLKHDSRGRIDQVPDDSRTPFALDAESEHIKVYMETWVHERANQDGSTCSASWSLSHDCLSCWLLLAVRIAKARLRCSQALGKSQSQSHNHNGQQQQLLLSLATRIFEEASKVPDAVRMTNRAAIFPFAASIILRLGSRRDLVLRVALNMAGEAFQAHVPSFVREAGVQTLLMLQ